MKQVNLNNSSKCLARCMFQSPSSSSSSCCSWQTETERICKLINDSPASALEWRLCESKVNISGGLVENVVGRLFSGQANGLKALKFFHWAQQREKYEPSSKAFERMLHILARMGSFDKAWEVLEEMRHQNKMSLKAASIVLSAYARRRSYEETVEAFERMEMLLGELNTDAFNVLLHAFCTQRHIKEARGIFNKMYHRFVPNTRTLNILLLGFKESGNATAAQIFFREIIRRGCKPSTVTYNILIDALCKEGRVDDALEVVQAMKKERECCPTIRTYTTLIHGLGIVRQAGRARQVFAEMARSGFEPDTAAYNALISCFCKAGDVEDALKLIDEMGRKGVSCDHVTYDTLFSALRNLRKEEDVCKLFAQMIARGCVLKVSTVTMLMKFFCGCGLHARALELWNYVIQKGCCPHAHVSNLLVTELCRSGKLQEAYDCLGQITERGCHPYGQSCEEIHRSFVDSGRVQQLLSLSEKMKQLRGSFLPV